MLLKRRVSYLSVINGIYIYEIFLNNLIIKYSFRAIDLEYNLLIEKIIFIK